MEEGQGERCLFVEFDGVEVQEVGFYGEGVGAECGAVAYVGDGFEGFAVGTGFGVGAGPDGESGDVDAVGGEEFVVGGEVDGGDGVAGAVPASGSGGGGDGEGMAEEGADPADVAFGDELADAAGGDGLVADGSWGVDLACEA